MTVLPGTAWRSIRDFQHNLYHELSIDPARPGPEVRLFGDIVYRDGPAPRAFWHKTALEAPFIAEFASIKEAADILRAIQRNWAHCPIASFRRAELIRERLPHVSEKPREFPYIVPRAPMGLWGLIDDKTLFASARTSSPFPGGELRFVEDHENPPSRAYLKMYEALAWVSALTGADETLNGDSAGDGGSASSIPTGRYTTVLPGPGSRCLDAGACPGGWTWALTRLGASVTAIDRAELHPSLMAHPDVTFIKHDAFTLSPEELGPQDWVCSDVICYPPRLLEWVNKWLESGLCQNYICTIKMQGNADHETTRAFADIPGSRVVHLTANKNELTWIRLAPSAT